MYKTARVMVYSATTEVEVSRQYAAGAAEAERSGYVPISEAWDKNTLTVTYQYRGGDTLAGQPSRAVAPSEDGGFWSRLSRRIGSR
jgi:hypothetical protein